jgi:N-acetylglucosamine-6-sulfatase
MTIQFITDLLTGHAIDWLNNRDKDKPFFMYLSHKAVHSNFQPAKRHKGAYEGKKNNTAKHIYTDKI